jgi:glycosyltransferase involved in cell wall biosynthesis
VGTEFKLLMAKILAHSPIRLIDAGCGRACLDMAQGNGLHKRLCLSVPQYQERVDRLILNANASFSGRMLQFPAAKIHRIPYGISAVQPESQRFGTDDQSRCNILGTICHMNAQSSWNFLIDAVKVLNGYQQAISIVVATEGGVPDRECCEKILSQFRSIGMSSVRFETGDFDIKELAATWKVLLSLSDNQLTSPMSLQVMAAGVPVVAREFPTARSTNRSISAAIRFAGSPRAMAGEILALLEDENRRKLLGSKGRSAVLRHFPVKKMIGEYMKLLG